MTDKLMIGPLTIFRIVGILAFAIAIIGVYYYDFSLEYALGAGAVGCFFLLIDLGVRISQKVIGKIGIIAYIVMFIAVFALILLHDPERTSELFSSL